LFRRARLAWQVRRSAAPSGSRFLQLGTLALILASRTVGAVHAQGSATGAFSNTPNSGSNLVGYHVDGPLNDPTTPLYPHGFSLDVSGSPWWSFGIDKSTKDFFLFSHSSGTTQFRMRGDTGQIAIGPSVSQPGAGTRQLDVVAGTDAAPLPGIRAKVYGAQNGVSLVQGRSTSSRTQLNFNNQWQIGTDWNQNVASQTPTLPVDLWLWDVVNSHQVMQISTADLVTFNYGATINGGATVNGGATLNGATINNSLAHSGSLSFFGKTPVVTQRAVITGCRSDGTALANLLLALKNLGLIDDQTTP
jgi:hypothetical protein